MSIQSNLALVGAGRERQLATGKRAGRTKHDFRRPICRSAIGQAIWLICARRRQLWTDVPVLFLNQQNIQTAYIFLFRSSFSYFWQRCGYRKEKTDEKSYITVHLEAKTNKIRKLTRTELHDGSYWNKKNKHLSVQCVSHSRQTAIGINFWLSHSYARLVTSSKPLHIQLKIWFFDIQYSWF